MDKKYLLYNNVLWEPYKTFTYTGEPEAFTLNSGTYLLVANGARGGNAVWNAFRSWGGTTYGVLDLDHTQSFYAFVGGNGEDTPAGGNPRAKGGWNGGGEGGISHSSGYYNGAGGGGASDIRLTLPGDMVESTTSYTLPEGYIPVEYIEGTYGTNQWIDTQYVHKTSTKIICDSYSTNSGSKPGYSAIYGARSNSYQNNAFVFFTRFASSDQACFNRTGNEKTGAGYPYNVQTHTVAYDKTITVYDITGETEIMSITSTGVNDNGVSSMLLFNLNNSTSSVTTAVDGSWFIGRIMKFIVLENDRIKRYMIPVRRESYVFDHPLSQIEQGSITSSGDNTSSTRVKSSAFYRVDDFKGTISCEAWTTDNVRLTWGICEYSKTERGTSYYTYDGPWVNPTGTATILSDKTAYIRIVFKRPDDSDLSPNQISSIRFTVSNPHSGMFDLVKQEFHANRSLNGDFVVGPDTHIDHYEYTYEFDRSLYTRIIVGAGGGGTCMQYDNDSCQDFMSFGGGPRSGWITVSSNGSSANNVWIAATQNYGNAFGVGGDAQDRINKGSSTWGMEGQGGGGGGWYGGFAAIGLQNTNLSYTACGGCGGSSYVLTSSSYKPFGYMYGFTDLMPSLYLKDTLMLPCQAFEGPSIEIYKPRVIPPLVGDRVIIPYTGVEQTMTLLTGTYKLKCYGGAGGTRWRTNQAAKGGYAEGIINLPGNTPLYYHVGNSSALIGMGTTAASHDAIFNNRMVYQSSVSNYSDYRYGAMSGGGSVDIRTEPVRYDSLLSRIPDGYDQVEYIKSDDSQCIKTTYVPKSTSNVECVVEIYRHSGWETLFGVRTAVNNTQFDLYTGMDGQDKMFFESGNSGTTSSFTMPYNQKIKITVIGNVVTLYDMEDNVLGSITGNARVNTSYPLYIFDVCTGGNVYGAYSETKIYYFKITEGSDVARYFVPFVNQEDSTDSGLYDLVTRTFHRRTGGSAFTVGEVVEKQTYTLKVDNTVNSRLSRIIVAGGGGGQGANGKYGGAGGGTSGNSYTGGGYGSNNGPGTQNSGYAFEVGGTGSAYNSGYGGSGGYGWYGGCGTAPDGSGDDDKAGCGGSGYVLTADSYKPTGYIPDERFYLTDTVLTTGGNTTVAMTRIVVEPIAIQAISVIAHDTEGYKGYDITTNEWYLLPSQVLSEELFDEYGAIDRDIDTDTGLLFPYTLLVSDKYEVGVNNITNHVLPTPQTVSFSVKTTAEILGETYDYDADENTTIDIDYNITGIAENRYVNITATFDMIDIPHMNPSLYMIQFQTRNKPSSYYYPIPPEKTIDDLDLLYVGHNVKIPNRYKPSIGGFMPDGTTAITTVGSSSSCSYKRNIYTATLINGSYIRFTRFNLIENKTYILRDIPLSSLSAWSFSAGPIGGSLLVDNDNMYLYHARVKNGSSWVWTQVLVVPLDPSLSYNVYYPGTSQDYCINCFGQAYWYGTDKIISAGYNALIIFNTRTKSFTRYASGVSDERNSFVIGDYTMLTFWNSDSNTEPLVYNRSTITRVTSGYSLSMAAGKKCACYGNGNYYVAQKGHIYVIKDRADFALVIDQDIIAPFSTIQPKTIHYSEGILYITFVNQSAIYAYNINTEAFHSLSLPFDTGNSDIGGQQWYRPAVYEGFFFIEHLKLFVTNALQAYKYRVGQKGDQLVIATNNSIEDKMTYDSRFVTVDNMGTTAHTGYIDKSLTEIDTTNHIFESEPYIQDEYRKFISLQIQSGEEE